MITETAEGDLDVKWQASIKDSDVLIPMRPSHVIGQLQSAIQIISQRTYGSKSS